MSAPGRFQQWVQGWRLAFNDVMFRAQVGAYAAILGDKMETFARAGLLESYPSYASPAALPRRASERQIEPGPTESLASIAMRSLAWIYLNRLRGRPLGMLLALHYAGFPGAVLVQQNGLGFLMNAEPVLADIIDMKALPSWCSLVELMPDYRRAGTLYGVAGRSHYIWPEPGHPWFGFDNDWSHCSRFAVIFPAGAPDPQLGTAANLARIQRVIATWKPAKALGYNITVVTGGVCWDWPVRTWDDFDALGLEWDDSQVTQYATG